MFKSVHVERNAKFHGKDLPDDSGTEGAESNYVRCKWCDTINKVAGKNARTRGDGRGGNITQADSGATATTLKYDIVGGNGCWFCGASTGW